MAFLNISVCFFLLVLATADPKPNRSREPTDSKRLFAAFPHAVAVFTSNNHTSFKCLSAKRTQFDPATGTATYVWHLKAHSGHKRKDVAFNLAPGDTPDTSVYYLNDDKAHQYKAYYGFTDYKTCVVLKVPYDNHEHCMLWVRRAVVHNVPQDCLEHYEGTCDIRVPLVDKDICKDDDE
ncbi:uncharacterized protein LOC125947259 [Dermacentor silvarum]|uniref:uncharacterized protein LOC125947259 n=1 Tax=Dermacentor silvarum TaxID=543639 RepID=UPI002101A746|nr:uncharacterized protein LOC125947259 [Dermacentor silvarum]